MTGEDTLRKGRILVVDDNAHYVFMLNRLLEHWGYEVRFTTDADQALSMLDDFRPDCVLTDIRMPGRDGYQLAEAIRLDDLHRSVLLIALTGEEDKARIHAAGFNHYLRKPVDSSVLQSLLKTSLKMDQQLERAEQLIESQGKVVEEARDLIKEVKGDVKEIKQELKEVKKDISEIKHEIRENGGNDK